MTQARRPFSSTIPLQASFGQSAGSSPASSTMLGRGPFSYPEDGSDSTTESLTRLHEWVRTIDRYVRLPNDFQTFSVFLIGLMLVFTGATLHVLVAAQIMQAEYELAALERNYIAIEQQNSELIFVYARDTNLNHLRAKAIANGYVPITERVYTVLAESELAGGDSGGTDALHPGQSGNTAVATGSGETGAPEADVITMSTSKPVLGASVEESSPAPMSQWKRLLRGEIAWQSPQHSSQIATERTAAAESNDAGLNWQARWQQILDQSRQIFTLTSLE